MPTIANVECHVFRAPITEPLANAFGAMTNRPAVFLRVDASDGSLLYRADVRRDLAECDAVVLCVPTPLTDMKEPDTTYVEAAARAEAEAAKR